MALFPSTRLCRAGLRLAPAAGTGREAGMPAAADRASVASHRRFPAALDRDWLGRVWPLRGAGAAGSVWPRAAGGQLRARGTRLPGPSVRGRLVAPVRERAPRRVHSRRARAAGPELRAQPDKLLRVPEGQRRSELDLLRRPPFTPTIAGLVRALDRLERVRALGTGGPDLPDRPAPPGVALAPHPHQAPATPPA